MSFTGGLFANSLTRLRDSLSGLKDGDTSPFASACIGAGVSEVSSLLPQIPGDSIEVKEMASQLRTNLLALQGARARPDDLKASPGAEADLLDSIDRGIEVLVPKLRETDFPDPA